MLRWLVGLVCFGWVAGSVPVAAATLYTESGSLAAAQTGTGASTNIVCVGSANLTSLTFQLFGTLGDLVVNVEASLNGGSNWSPAARDLSVLSGLTGSAAGTALFRTLVVMAPPPHSCWRTNATTNTTGSLNVLYQFGPEVR